MTNTITTTSATYGSRKSAVRAAKRAGLENVIIVNVEDRFAYTVLTDDDRNVIDNADGIETAEVIVDVPDVVSVLAPVTEEQIAAHVEAAPVAEVAPLAPVKLTKKQQLRAFISAQAASVEDIATHFAISLAAARSLIGDIQREGDKLVVEKVEGFRAGFYRYA